MWMIRIHSTEHSEGIQYLAPAEAIENPSFLGSDQEKKYCWQAQKLVEIIFTGEVAYETKI